MNVKQNIIYKLKSKFLAEIPEFYELWVKLPEITEVDVTSWWKTNNMDNYLGTYELDLCSMYLDRDYSDYGRFRLSIDKTYYEDSNKTQRP